MRVPSLGLRCRQIGRVDRERNQPRVPSTSGGVGYLCSTIRHRDRTHFSDSIRARARRELLAPAPRRRQRRARRRRRRAADRADASGAVARRARAARSERARRAAGAGAARRPCPTGASKVGDPRAYLSTRRRRDRVRRSRARSRRQVGVPAGSRALGAAESRLRRRSVRDRASIRSRPSSATPTKIIAEPLAGQLRAFAGLFNARYALVPVELRLAPDAARRSRDAARSSSSTRAARRLTWKGDVTGDAVATFSPAIAAGLAGRVADLFTRCSLS